MPRFAYLAVCSIAAFVTLAYFFCPSFVYWRAMEVPFAWHRPEINRGIETLRLLADPFHAELSESNGVIRWRLLFPLLGHSLGLPEGLYLALPHLGCVLALALIGAIVLRRTGDRLFAFLAMLLLGAASWCFVSIGWLGYFDSWYAIGLLAAAFLPSRAALVAACIFTPWIDERFVVALPLVLLVRQSVLRDAEPLLSSREMIRDAGACAVCVVPWVAFRLWLVATGADPSGFAQSGASHLHADGAALRIAVGLLHGLRAGWVLAAIALVGLCRRGRRALAWATGSVALATVAVSVYLAADVARNTATLLPLVLAGVLSLRAIDPARAVPTASWLCAADAAAAGAACRDELFDPDLLCTGRVSFLVGAAAARGRMGAQ